MPAQVTKSPAKQVPNAIARATSR
jgi:hypothetical protein